MLLVLAAPVPGRAQGVFWSDNFENGCNKGCLASTWNGWTIQNVGSNPAGGNTWYVSCQENLLGACGAGCLPGSNESLHVANPAGSPCAFLWCPAGDCGAAYDACGPVSNKRAVSPAINCFARAGISVTFKYLGLGDPCLDGASFEYSDNGGSSWSTIAACPAMTAPVCGNGQGQVTTFSANLPASANNNPNVRIGFRWQNNADFDGADPSFAVDDIEVRFACAFPVPPLPMDLDDDLRVTKAGANVHLDWSLMQQLPSTTHFHVYRSTSPAATFPWTQIAGDSPKLTAKVYDDPVVSNGVTYYYDVRSADDCESICPKPIFVAATSSSPSCDGSGAVTFASAVSGGQPPFTYDWDFGDFSPHSNVPNPTHTYGYPPHAYTATLTVTDSSLPAPQVKGATVAVRVGPGDLAASPTQDSPKSVGVPVNFQANASGGVPPYTFQWSFGDGATSALQDPSHVYSAPGTYTATLVLKDSRGCRVDPPPMTVFINPGLGQ